MERVLYNGFLKRMTPSHLCSLINTGESRLSDINSTLFGLYKLWPKMHLPNTLLQLDGMPSEFDDF